MTSPARWIVTVSPMRTPRRSISSALCSVALDTTTPPAQFFTALHARRQEYAGYLEQEGRLIDGLMLVTGGVRVDGNSDFGIEVSPSWTVAIPLERWGVTLRGSYSEGFRAPSFNELFFPNFGNPKLNPEISSEYDGGITKTFGETASLTATYFSRRVHSLIVAEPCTAFPGCVEAANAGERPRRSLEDEFVHLTGEGFDVD